MNVLLFLGSVLLLWLYFFWSGVKSSLFALAEAILHENEIFQPEPFLCMNLMHISTQTVNFFLRLFNQCKYSVFHAMLFLFPYRNEEILISNKENGQFSFLSFRIDFGVLFGVASN